MKWISRTFETLGVEWKDEGWFFDTPMEDYLSKLLCKNCGATHCITQCKKNRLRGYLGDDCAALVFYLDCPKCNETLSVLDETADKFRPMLKINKDTASIIIPSNHKKHL